MSKSWQYEVETHMYNSSLFIFLRRSFQKMSTSPEAFHTLRCHCMRSHAMLSVCQYLLGIGDRHLSNFMVNLKSGEIVGIDFGHAFGSATQVRRLLIEQYGYRHTRVVHKVWGLGL